MSRTAHVREEALHLENVRQLFQVLRVIQYQEFIVFYLSHPLKSPGKSDSASPRRGMKLGN